MDSTGICSILNLHYLINAGQQLCQTMTVEMKLDVSWDCADGILAFVRLMNC